ncbi:MAG: carboxypeptidase-like regulatory domain-containing protein, partial [Bacteroidales bacterium]|nr:carboxypeptidase-like regulatory domain-containing protein [Bacteroidales bacterium]
MKYYFKIILLLFLSINLFAQDEPKGVGTISGFVIDEISNNTVEYANVVLYSKQDSSLVTGGITNAKGYF